MRLHETELVERLKRLAGTRRQRVSAGQLRLLQGIGDDCAVFTGGAGKDLLVTTDLFIEDVHFKRAWQSAHSIGHKVLTRGLSDIAAMGGDAKLAFLSLALPRRSPQRWINEFLSGFLALANRYSVVLAGGDTGSSPHGFMADIIVLGEVPHGTAVLRSGARAGDEIWVSGQLGGAAAELARLRSGSNPTKPAGRGEANPYFYPQVRAELGALLRKRGLATAMMDITDGLSLDLLRLTKASGVGGVIEEAAIPIADGATLPHALHGGDDFELLFTVPQGQASRLPKSIGGVHLTRVGRTMRRAGVRLLSEGKERPLAAKGYQHF